MVGIHMVESGVAFGGVSFDEPYSRLEVRHGMACHGSVHSDRLTLPSFITRPDHLPACLPLQVFSVGMFFGVEAILMSKGRRFSYEVRALNFLHHYRVGTVSE